MESPVHVVQSSFSLIRILVSFLPLKHVDLFIELYHAIRRWWRPTTDIYEILHYEATIELLDDEGEKAFFTKHQQVRFLQDHVIAFEDYVWGDGDVFADYKCSPGVMVDKYKEGDRWNVLISLRQTKHKGDTVDFYIQRTEKRTFTKNEEWLQVELRHPTKHLVMNVIFPKKRLCKQASIIQRSRNRTTLLDTHHFRFLPDGRQLLTWEIKKVLIYDLFTLRWRW